MYFCDFVDYSWVVFCLFVRFNEVRIFAFSLSYKFSTWWWIGNLLSFVDVTLLSVCLDNVSRRLLNCGISVSFSPVPEYLHAQLIYRSVLSIALLMLYLAKVGRIASEETVLELIKTKCIPALMFGMEACPLKKRDINSLDFVVNRLFTKLLKTSDINIVRTCQHMFGFELPSVLLACRRTIENFWKKNEKFMSWGESF